MDFVNQVDTLQAIMRLNEQLKKAKNDLHTFLNSQEGDAKTATNTQKEESAIAYWKNILEKQRQDHENTQQYMKSQLEQLRVNYERSVGLIQKQAQQNEINYLTASQSMNSRLATAEEALQRKLARKKPKRQLELEKAVQDCEKTIAVKQKIMEDAKKSGKLV